MGRAESEIFLTFALAFALPNKKNSWRAQWDDGTRRMRCRGDINKERREGQGDANKKTVIITNLMVVFWT